MQESNDRAATSTAPEDIFTELFTQVFGPEKALYLSPQHPVTDIDGKSRFVDLALRSRGEKIAFEVDGLPWHVPEVVPAANYEDDRLRIGAGDSVGLEPRFRRLPLPVSSTARSCAAVRSFAWEHVADAAGRVRNISVVTWDQMDMNVHDRLARIPSNIDANVVAVRAVLRV
jgi:hypothetical protein